MEKPDLSPTRSEKQRPAAIRSENDVLSANWSNCWLGWHGCTSTLSLRTVLTRQLMQSVASVRVCTSVRQFPLWLLNRETFDLDLLHFYGSWLYSSREIEGQGQRSKLGLGLESLFDTRSVGPRSSIEGSSLVDVAIEGWRKACTASLPSYQKRTFWAFITARCYLAR